LTDSDDNTVSEAYENDPFFDYEIDDEIDKLSEPYDDAKGEDLSIRNRDPKGKYFYDQSDEEKALGMDQYNRDLWADNEWGRPYDDDDDSDFSYKDKKELNLRAKKDTHDEKMYVIYQINKHLEYFGKKPIRDMEHEPLEVLEHYRNKLRNIVASHKNARK